MAEFAGDGEGDEVGEADAVDGGDEGDGDAAANLIDFIEVLHDLDESEDGADDSDGWGEASGGFIDAGQLVFGFGAGVEFKLHDGAQLAGLGAIDGEHEGAAHEGIGDVGQFGVERDDAVAARLLGQFGEAVDLIAGAGTGLEQDDAEIAHGGEDGR